MEVEVCFHSAASWVVVVHLSPPLLEGERGCLSSETSPLFLPVLAFLVGASEVACLC